MLNSSTLYDDGPDAEEWGTNSSSSVPHIHVLDQAGQPLQTVELPLNGLTIGSQVTNGLVLQGNGVSRNHLRLTWDGHQVVATDLGTRNGTRLDGNPMMPQVGQVWDWGEPLQIGQYQLALEPPADLNGTFPSDQPFTGETLSNDSGRIGVALETGKERLDLTPGQPAIIQVTMLNRGAVPDLLSVTVEGVPADWVDLPNKEVEVAPGGQATIALNVIVPRTPAGRAGEHVVTVRARSHENLAESAVARSRWNVLPFVADRLEVLPKKARGRRGAVYNVIVRNQGNASNSYRLTAGEDETALEYELAQREVVVEPGNEAKVQLTVRTPNQLVGNARTYRFHAQMTPLGGVRQAEELQFIHLPPLPRWFIPLAALLLLLLFAGGTLAAVYQLTTKSTSTPTTIALNPTDSVAKTNVPIGPSTVVVGTPNSTAEAETAIAAETATQTWLDGDDDHDGLSNADELAQDTDPKNRDTDGDGLDDRTELERGTNPLVQDTDGDGVKDGEEVRRGMNPSFVDTDGDGIPDAVDPDPLHGPTAVPSTPTVTNGTPTVEATSKGDNNNDGGGNNNDGGGNNNDGGGNNNDGGGNNNDGGGNNNGGNNNGGNNNGGNNGTTTQPSVVPTTAPVRPKILISSNEDVGEDGGQATFTVSLSEATTNRVTVFYATKNRTAKGGEDYTSTGQSQLVFEPGNTSQSINVAITDDQIDEDDQETFEVDLSNAENADIVNTSSICTIEDNDSPPSISISNPSSVDEGNDVTFSVSISSMSDKTVTVHYKTSDMSAKDNRDYVGQSDGTVSIAPGSETGTFDISTINTDAIDGTRSFRVTLSSPENATIKTSSAIATINDDDKPATPVAVDDEFTILEDENLTIDPPGVLKNDQKGTSASIQAKKEDNPRDGTVTLNSNGSFTYKPKKDSNNQDSFTYSVTDGSQTYNVAKVNIIITPVNDPPSFTKGSDIDTADNAGLKTINWATNISAGPSDEQANQTTNFEVKIDQANDSNLFAQQPAIDPKGVLTFTPKKGQNGTADVKVRIHDTGGTNNGGIDTSDWQHFNIHVQANVKPFINLTNSSKDYIENNAPVLVDDQAQVNDDTPDFNGGSLVINITQGLSTTDQLMILTGNTIDVINGSVLTFGGTPIGTVVEGVNKNSLTINFNSDIVTADVVKDLVKRIAYRSTADSFSPHETYTRRVSFTLTEADNLNGSATRDIRIIGVNDPSYIRFPLDTMQYTDINAVIIDNTAIITDSDVPNRFYRGGTLTIEITDDGGLSNNTISITTTNRIDINNNNIRYNFPKNNPNNIPQGRQNIGTINRTNTKIVINFNSNNNNATIDAVQALVRSITYKNTSASASRTGVVVITFTLVDGDGKDNNGNDTSETTKTINVGPVP